MCLDRNTGSLKSKSHKPNNRNKILFTHFFLDKVQPNYKTTKPAILWAGQTAPVCAASSMTIYKTKGRYCKKIFSSHCLVSAKHSKHASSLFSSNNWKWLFKQHCKNQKSVYRQLSQNIQKLFGFGLLPGSIAWPWRLKLFFYIRSS